MLSENPRLARLLGGFPEWFGLNLISWAQLLLLRQHKDPEVVRLIRQVRRERRSLLTAYEAYTIYSLAHSLADSPGEMAEVGCFQGASTKILLEACPGKPLHVFDTFEGLPPSTAPDQNVHTPHDLACSLELVREYLAGYENVHYYKGLFPDTSGPVEDRKFSFVHCDVDLYGGTLACLEFFYPRLIPGGVLISHDYSILKGVKTAFSEFLADKPERAIELPSTQAMIIKR